MGGTKILSGSQSGIIAPRPAGPYPDISLAGKNPMSVALTERHHKSQDNYLLGKNQPKTLRPSFFANDSLATRSERYAEFTLGLHAGGLDGRWRRCKTLLNELRRIGCWILSWALDKE